MFDRSLHSRRRFGGSAGGFELFEGLVADGVVAPVFVVEVPPLVFVDGEAFGFHGGAKEVSELALEGCAAGVVGVGAFAHFVVEGGHFDGRVGFEVVEGDVGGTTAIVFGAAGGVGDEVFELGRGGFPEDPGDEPGAVGVVDDDAVAGLFQPIVGADEGFGGGPLEVGAGGFVDGGGEEVVCAGVADVEADGGVEGGDVDERVGAEGAGFGGRGLFESFDAELGDGAGGGEAEGVLGGEGEEDEEERGESRH